VLAAYTPEKFIAAIALVVLKDHASAKVISQIQHTQTQSLT
jgi:hypothetical protein